MRETFLVERSVLEKTSSKERVLGPERKSMNARGKKNSISYEGGRGGKGF